MHPRWPAWKSTLKQVCSGIMFLINSSPQISSSIFGSTWYEASKKRFGQETWWAPHNLWRNGGHGGVGAGLAYLMMAHLGLNVWVTISLVYALALSKELWDNRKINIKWMKKNTFDVLGYSSGAFIVALVRG